MATRTRRDPGDQMVAILQALDAYRGGNFGARLPADWTGLEGKVADALNEVIATNQSIHRELGRLREVVGKQGRITERLPVGAAARGEWAESMHAVNDLIEDLARPTGEIARVIEAVARGDLSQTVSTDVDGHPLQGQFRHIAAIVNTMVSQLSSFAVEVTRVAHEVGTQGRLGGQATVRDVGGVWKDLTDSVNTMAANLTTQVRNIAEVTTAVANGDLSRKITVQGRGEILELKDTVNEMTDTLATLADQVTAVAREVGVEGRLGGQASVPGARGTWADLTDNVNQMAANLTAQVRNIAEVTTAVADGDLSRKITVQGRGEILELKDTVNEMTDTLATLADQVTAVAREVGVEGRLGGQASVPGASGTWKHLTDNVNQLASTLTVQIRAIADVATAVTQGDLTRSIAVEASGEVAVLKDKLNEMIRNLRLTTERNAEQDWLKTNLARFTGMLQGQRDLDEVSSLILSELAPLIGAQLGTFYVVDTAGPEPVLRLQAGYAARGRVGLPEVIQMGEGLAGQCALDLRRLLVANVPSHYVSSTLGKAPTLNLVVLPVLFEGQIRAVIELASFQPLGPTHLDFLDRLMESIGVVLNNIEATMRTERLLQQSQSLAEELQAQQAELRRTNGELAVQARQLAEQNSEVERQNREIEESRRSLQEQADQLALTSKYKSEFLANMSHELRTPLNSLLILAEQLANNQPGNLDPRQVESARLIRSSGQDLLGLINDILDLSKIESGTVALDMSEVTFWSLREAMERGFRHVADARGLGFEIVLEPGLPERLRTDARRLQQVLRNLLANAFKFTEKGGVVLRIRMASSRRDQDVGTLREARRAAAFEIEDTGIGIHEHEQRRIFEAFQQAEGAADRAYGGTGLGLSISRELVRLLGGQITLRSALGEGSTFTVYLPLGPAPVGRPARLELPPAIPTGALLPQSPPSSAAVGDDRSRQAVDAPSVLIVEDDPNFARILLDLAHQSGFKGVVALSGSEALKLARDQLPTAVTLDIGLADMSGWKVLDSLKRDPGSARVPVHVLTVFDDAGPMARRNGAASFLAKPVSKESLDELFSRIRVLSGRGGLLIVDDDDLSRRFVVEATHELDVTTLQAGSAAEAIDVLRRHPVACVVLDLLLPDASGFDLLKRIQRNRQWRRLPVIAYTGAELTSRERAALQRRSAEVIQKGGPDAMRRLVEQVGRFLAAQQRANGEMVVRAAPGQTVGAPELREADARPLFPGRRVLVVDDDVRTLFAMAALLEDWGMLVASAKSGEEALALLRREPAPDVALVDVMMPGKDGYQTIREIRRIPGRERLHIVAVTAKATPRDQKRCLEAGANAYVPKPIEVGHLRERLSEQLGVKRASKE